jgi:hypothetical protein
MSANTSTGNNIVLLQADVLSEGTGAAITSTPDPSTETPPDAIDHLDHSISHNDMRKTTPGVLPNDESSPTILIELFTSLQLDETKDEDLLNSTQSDIFSLPTSGVDTSTATTTGVHFHSYYSHKILVAFNTSIYTFDKRPAAC